MGIMETNNVNTGAMVMWRQAKVGLAVALGALIVWAASAAVAPEAVTSRGAELDGAQVGEVLISGQSVILIRTGTADYSPAERADIIAGRLRTALAGEVTAASVRVDRVAVGDTTYDAVYVGGALIVAVTQQEADAHGATTVALATLWRDNIARALGEAQPAPTPGPPPTGPPTPAPQPATPPQPAAPPTTPPTPAVDWTGSAQKWVPIFSLETSGAAIGAAQVAGPPAQLEKTKAVMQLRLDFKSIGRIYAYIPVASISTKLDRVQGVSVWAIGDIQLAKF